MSHDLMHSDEVKELVRAAYRHVPPTTAAVAHKIYSSDELAMLPDSAVNRALGVANHLRYADIRLGETILDPGCGGGIDTILAAQRTGPTGKVIALDFLPEMLDRTADAVQEAGLTNVELVEGDGGDSVSGRECRPDHLQRRDQSIRPEGQGHGRVRPGLASRRTACVSDLTVDQDDLPQRLPPSQQPGRAASLARWRRTASCTSWNVLDSRTPKWWNGRLSASTTVRCIRCSPTR